jgi:CheY-like chemotaxis protein
MIKKLRKGGSLEARARRAEGLREVRRQQTLLKTGALQNAILSSANFSSIATDEKGVIQIFNVGAERMLGYAAADVMNHITPADISDPEEVIARAREVILMDINLPGISGIEALKILREDPATAHIPVLALSANALPVDIKKGLKAGFFRYLTKPIKINEFTDALNVALQFAQKS